jgi:diadenosine tetraphosphatase ApaH/serine/threonine PP2A family protein phosphatase
MTVRDAWLPLRESPTRINFFGHTHLQGGFATNGEEWFRLTPKYGTRDRAEGFDLQLRNNGRYLINPGSVGQPRDGDWRAAFALYDDDAMMVTFCRVPYDVRQAQNRILEAGLPDRLATRLREGR